MLFNVPQHINVEDKIAGPLTAKQLMWMFGMGAAMLVIYASIPDRTVFFMAAIPTALVFLALAFYRPQGQPLISFVIAFFYFLFRPKIYVWKRSAESRRPASTVKIQPVFQKRERIITQQEISGLAKILDTHGRDKNDAVVEYLMKKEQQKQAAAAKKSKRPFGIPLK